MKGKSIQSVSENQEFKVLKILKGHDPVRDLSVIALVQSKIDGKTYILKVEKYPGWSIIWEYRVAYCIENHLKFVEHFSRIHKVQTMSFNVNERDQILSNLSFDEKFASRKSWATISEYVEGISFATKIKTPSFRKLFSGIYQILIALFCAQKTIYLTHYDLHANNMITQEVDPNILYLFDIVPINNENDTVPIMVWSEGMLNKIIDYEYTFVNGLSGKSFDAKTDLCSKGYNPSKPDPGYDCLRFLISTLTYYSELHKDSWIRGIRDTLVSTFNQNVNSKHGKIDKHGVLSDMKDTLRKKVLTHPLLKQKFYDNHVHHDRCYCQFRFMEIEYYQIINLISHNLKIPIQCHESYLNVPEKVHLENIVRLFILIGTPVFQHHSQILRILYHISDLIHEKSNKQNFEEHLEKDRLVQIAKYTFLQNPKNFNGEENAYLWVLELYISIQETLPNLEYLLFKQLKKISDERILHQNAHEFTPIKLFNFFNNYYYTQDNQFSPETEIHWMKQTGLEVIKLKDIIDKENLHLYNILNKQSSSILEKSTLLKRVLIELTSN